MNSLEVNLLCVLRSILVMLAYLTQVTGHWAPWHVIPFIADERGRLHRLAAYSYGTLCILSCVFIDALLMDALYPPRLQIEQFKVMVLYTVAAGGGTTTGYAVDWLGEWFARRKDEKDMQALRDVDGAPH